MRLDFTGVDERISEWQFRSGNFGAAILDRYNGTMVLWYYVTMVTTMGVEVVNLIV